MTIGGNSTLFYLVDSYNADYVLDRCLKILANINLLNTQNNLTNVETEAKKQ